MIQEYKINGISGTWLHQPGMMVYVETEYNEEVNRVIKRYHRAIDDWCKQHGLIFLYIPEFYKSGSWNWVSYMIGKNVWSLPAESTTIVLKHSFSETSFSQINGASFLFTSDKDDSTSAYMIDEKEIRKSIISILTHYQDNSIPQIEKELFNDPLDELRNLFHKDKMDERKKAEKDDIKYKKGLTGKLSSCFSSILADEEEEEERNSCRFRVVTRDEFIEKPTSHKETIDDGLNEEDDIDMHLFQEAQKAIVKLLNKGYSKATIWALLAPMQELSPIHVKKDYRIELPLYGKEIELPPVQKAIYLLFLKHPEGIYFKNLPDYEEELYHIYRKLAIRGTKEKHVQTVKDLVDPLGNSMNEKCSLIKKRILAILDDCMAKHYYISGEKGELKRIDMKPEMIVWE